MNRSNIRSAQFHFRIDHDDSDRLDRLAKGEGITVSLWIRRAINTQLVQRGEPDLRPMKRGRPKR